jgi:hypothetical protein
LVQTASNVIALKLGNFLLLHQGVLENPLELFDDGTHGDLKSGDHVFTVDQITFATGSEPVWQGLPLISSHINMPTAIVTYSDQTTETNSAGHDLVFRMIRNEDYAPVAVTQLAADVQKTDYCLNIVLPIAPPNYDFDPAAISNRYYTLFPDDRDFLVIGPTSRSEAIGAPFSVPQAALEAVGACTNVLITSQAGAIQSGHHCCL